MEAKIRVLLADDHPLVRAGIRATLMAQDDLELVGEAADGDQVQQLCQTQSPDVLLLDLHMPGPSALQTVAFLRERLPAIRVIMLTAYDDDAYVRSLVAAGAVGYILKDEAPEVVVRAIRTVMHGDTWFSRAIIEKLNQPSAQILQVGDAELTERERELLAMIGQGCDNAQIAETLSLAEQTVRNSISRLYAKLGLTSRAQAIIWTRERGFTKK